MRVLGGHLADPTGACGVSMLSSPNKVCSVQHAYLNTKMS